MVVKKKKLYYGEISYTSKLQVKGLLRTPSWVSLLQESQKRITTVKQEKHLIFSINIKMYRIYSGK